MSSKSDSGHRKPIKMHCHRDNPQQVCYEERVHQEEWDFIEVAMTWPFGVCRTGHCCPRANFSEGFVVQGIRSAYNTDHSFSNNQPNRMYATCCPTKYTTDDVGAALKADKQLQKDIELYWPEFMVDQLIEKEEWDRYGTCLSSIYSPEEYLKLAITLRKRYDLFAMITEAGIAPSYDTFALSKFKEAIESHLGVKPRYECDHHFPAIIVDVWLCFERNAEDKFNPKLVNCQFPDICFNDVYLLNSRIPITITPNHHHDHDAHATQEEATETPPLNHVTMAEPDDSHTHEATKEKTTTSDGASSKAKSDHSDL